MGVDVVVMVFVVAVAQFVTDTFSGIFQHMHQMGFPKNGERAGDNALIHGLQGLFQLHQRQRTAGICQLTRNQDTIGRRLDAMRLQQGFPLAHSSSSNSSLQ